MLARLPSWLFVLALLALAGPVSAQDASATESAAPAVTEQTPAAAEPEEELLPPDEELAPDDLFFDDQPGSGEGATAGAPEAAEGTDAAAASGDVPAAPSAADDLEAESLGLVDAPAAEPAAPTEPPVVAETEGRTASQLTTALTIGLVGCGALAAVGGIIGVIANPVVAALMVFNAFAPAIALSLCGGTLVINQTLAAASGWAMCVAAPAPALVATGAGAAGTAGQVAVTRPWVPLGAAALAAVPGVIVGMVAGGIILGGVAYGLSIEHLNTGRLQRGNAEIVYLTLPRAITGAVVALIGAILGVVAAPLAGGAAVGVGYAVAGMEGVEDEAAAAVAERPSTAPPGAPAVTEVAW